MHTALRSSAFLSACCLIVAVAALIVLPAPAASAGAEEAGFDAAHRVTFRSGATPADKLNFDAPHDQIAGYLYRPEGEGPFPAVVLEPDYEGLHAIQKEWALRLVQWGYVALAVDILSRPEIKSSAVITAHDAYGALKYLSGLQYVDAQRVAWIGWSHHGGQTIMQSGLEADPKNPEQPVRTLVSEGPWRFQAGIAINPECPGIGKTYYAPMLLILPGKHARDLETCKATAEQSTAGGEAVQVKVYPEATNRFDVPGVKLDLFGEPAQYDAAATEDAIAQVQAFLAADRSGGWGHYLAKQVRRGWSWVSGK